MARKRTIEISQLNVAMHAPHGPDAYVQLFRHAHGAGYVMRRGRADGYRLGSLYALNAAVENDLLEGEIFRYTMIDKDSAWFNMSTGKPAADADTLGLSIPANLQPNLDRIPFVFRPRAHRLWFVSRDRKASLAPQTAAIFFQRLFDFTTIKGDLSPVEVTAVPEADAVDSMLRLPHIAHLVLEFKRPNADDDNELERRILEKMEARKVARQKNELTALDKDGIIADSELRAEARVAANNGYVSVIGKDRSGHRVADSTQKRPMRRYESVDSTTTIWDVLRRMISGATGKN